MGSSLIVPEASHPAVLANAEAASGLAEMLHQFLEQTLGEGPEKIRQARKLEGQLVFRAAEDPSVCVQILFSPDKVEVSDVTQAPAGVPALTADFLAVAHLTSGEESPLGLLLRRRLRAEVSLGDLPFLIGVLGFMRLPEDGSVRDRRRLVLLVLVLALAAISWFVCYFSK